MYTVEMTYAHMRELQELADRSRAHKATPKDRAPKSRGRRHTKKR